MINVTKTFLPSFDEHTALLKKVWDSAWLKICEALKKQQIFPRRYFYPSLNKLPYLTVSFNCPLNEDISKRVLGLSLYVGLEEEKITQIAGIINLNPF